MTVHGRSGLTLWPGVGAFALGIVSARSAAMDGTPWGLLPLASRRPTLAGRRALGVPCRRGGTRRDQRFGAAGVGSCLGVLDDQ